MQAIRNFIIEVKDPFKDHIDIGDVNLFVNKDISRERASNRFGKVVAVPAIGESDGLHPGYEVIFDATILYRQIYRDVKQESIFLVHREKSWYKIEPDMIVLYRKDSDDQWKGFRENLMLARVVEKAPKTIGGGLLYFPTNAPTPVHGRAVVKYANTGLAAVGVSNGDRVLFNENYAIPFYFGKEELLWLRTKDVVGHG